jgi:hypothetical protein
MSAVAQHAAIPGPSEFIHRLASAAHGVMNPGKQYLGLATIDGLRALSVVMAVLSAAREPTEDMLSSTGAASVACWDDPCVGVHPDQWRAMIDAAME